MYPSGARGALFSAPSLTTTPATATRSAQFLTSFSQVQSDLLYLSSMLHITPCLRAHWHGGMKHSYRTGWSHSIKPIHVVKLMPMKSPLTERGWKLKNKCIFSSFEMHFLEVLIWSLKNKHQVIHISSQNMIFFFLCAFPFSLIYSSICISSLWDLFLNKQIAWNSLSLALLLGKFRLKLGEHWVDYN